MARSNRSMRCADPTGLVRQMTTLTEEERQRFYELIANCLVRGLRAIMTDSQAC